MSDSDARTVAILWIVVAFVCYWIPSVVAKIRKHPNTGAIFAVNFLLGWTVVGWIVAFIWGLTNPASSQSVTVVAGAPAAPSAARSCTKCGFHAAADAKFCTHCGASFQAPSPAAV